MALFVTCHCALRNVDHLTKLNKRIFSSAKGVDEIHLRRTKCTGVIRNIIASHFASELIKDVGEGPYSLLVDESTDISVNKQLGVSILYISKNTGEFVATFLTLHNIEKGDAETIANAIVDIVKKFGLALQKMRGLGADNASVMTGGITGVYQRLLPLIPHLILIRCVCHSIQLAMSTAVKETLPKHLEFLVSETYSWFGRSSDRRKEYEKLYAAMNNGEVPLKILKLFKIRWLSTFPCCKRILAQWVELRLHFSLSASKNICYTAETLVNMYSDVRNELCLLFLVPLLEEAHKTNKLFQTNENDPVKLLQSLVLLIKGLAQQVVVPGCRADLLKADIKDFLHPKPHLGYLFEDKMREVRTAQKPALNVDEEIVIRQRCVNFVVALVSELQRRLPDNIEVLEKVSLLSPTNCLCPSKQPMAPLAQLMCVPRDTIPKVDFQWSKLSYVEWNAVEKTVQFWKEVSEYKDAARENPFEELVELSRTCLVLAWSDGEVERLFSEMNVVKTPHRNKLKDATLHAVLTIRAGLRRVRKCCSTYVFPPEVLEKIGTNAAYRPAGDKVTEGAAGTSRLEEEDEDDDIDDVLRLLEPFDDG